MSRPLPLTISRQTIAPARAEHARSEPSEWIGIASSREEVLSALSLVYATYVRNGLMTANRYGLRVTRHHAVPSTEIVIAARDHQVFSTMTIIRDGDLGLPLEEIYHEEVALRRTRGLRLAEVGCLANGGDDDDGAVRALVRLMSLTAQLSKYRGVDELLIAVHPRHAPFYERFLAFQLIGEERIYETVCRKPAVLLALDLNRLAETDSRARDRLFGEPFPKHVLYRRPLKGALRDELRCLAQWCETEGAGSADEDSLRPNGILAGNRGSHGVSAA